MHADEAAQAAVAALQFLADQSVGHRAKARTAVAHRQAGTQQPQFRQLRNPLARKARGIEGIANKGSSTGQEGGTHYVKRLCGIPGDTLSIQDSQLIVNGKPATEWTIQRVASGKPPYQPCGYVALPAPLSLLDGRAYITEGGTVHLSNDSKRPYLREYVALGDNSTRENSFDSRYWGPVRQYNIVGPASFCLWPFTSHWGLIP